MSAKDIIKITINLVVIYVLGGLLLAFVYAKASPVIYKNNEKAKQEALKQLFPDADKIEKIGDWHPYEKHAEYYEAKKGDKVVGYIVQSFGKGYSSYIDVLFSVNTSFVIQKIDILHQTETPGLGDEISTPDFLKQFQNKKVEHMKVSKIEKEGTILSITGATISSRAVTEDAVKKGLEFLESKIKANTKAQAH